MFEILDITICGAAIIEPLMGSTCERKKGKKRKTKGEKKKNINISTDVKVHESLDIPSIVDNAFSAIPRSQSFWEVFLNVEESERHHPSLCAQISYPLTGGLQYVQLGGHHFLHFPRPVARQPGHIYRKVA